MSLPNFKFGDVAKVVTGSTPSKKQESYYGDEIPFITPSELTDGALGKPKVYLSKEGAEKARVLPQDSVLVCCIGSLGKVGFTTERVATNQQINALIFDKKSVFPRYGFYFCQTLKPLMEHIAPSTTVAIINKSMFSEFKIPLPPLEEQKRIAAILDKADTLRQKRQKAIALTDDLLRSVFLDIFGDPVTNPKGWSTVTLERYLTSLTSGSRGWAKYYAESGGKFLRIQNVGYAELKSCDMAFVNAPEGAEAKRTLVKENDVLLSITADLGRTTVIPEDFGEGYINQHLAKFSLKDVCPYFVSAYISSQGGLELLKAKNKGGVKSGLNFDDIRSIPIFYVGEEFQDKYRKIRHKIIQQKLSFERANRDTNLLFSSLTQRAFKHELTSQKEAV